MLESDGDTFCKKMRKATREIHAVSDALVNAKLAFGELQLRYNLSFVCLPISFVHSNPLYDIAINIAIHVILD